MNEVLKRCLDNNALEKELMSRCYDYFHGTNDNPLNSLFSAFDIEPTKGEGKYELPVIHMKVNKIKPKIQALVGDLIDLGFEAHVEAINQEAKAAKLEYRNEMMALFNIKDKLSEIDKLVGIESPDLPETLEKLEDFFKKGYKENSEVVMEACLKYSLEYNQYLMQRLQMFLDVIISRECHVKTFLQKGFPLIERINPLNVYYPVNLNDNEYLDKTYELCVVYYAHKSEVIDKFNLTAEEVEKDLEAAKGGGIEGAWYGRTVRGNAMFTPYDRDNPNLVLVSEAYWSDNKPERVTIATTKDGIEDVIIRYGEEAETYKPNLNRWKKKGKELKEDQKRVVSTIRKAVRIGCNIIKDWGEVEGVTCAPLTWATSELPITSFRPYYMQGQSQSTVADTMGLQDFRNYIWTKLQLETSKSSGKVIVINLKAIPKSFGASPQEAIPKVLHYMKGYNIIFRDEENELVGSDGRANLPVDEVDMGLSTAVNAFFTLLSLTDSEMDTITGLNQARMGEVANNQLASVTTMALNQSAKQTKHIINGFLQFESKLLSKHAQHIKYSWWMYPKAWATAIGDVYYAFMEATRDISLDIHMVTVKNDVISKQTLKEYMIASLQSGSMQPHDALQLEMMASDSIKEAVREYIRKMEKQREESMQMQQQQMEMQQQMAQEQMAAKQSEIAQQGDNQLQDRKLKGEYDLQKQAMRDQANAQQKQAQAQQQSNAFNQPMANLMA